jgi:chromate reductase
MADKVNVITIVGSLRKGSYNEKFPIYNADLQGASGFPADVTALSDAVRAADGVIFVTPEYNYGIPGGLKNAIDWVSRVRERGDPTYAAFKNRVFAIASASPGRIGGLRSLMALRQILELGCGALVIPEQVAIPNADQAFDAMDNLADAGLANLLRAELARLLDVARLMM